MSLFVATQQQVVPLPQQTVKVELDPLTFSLKVFPEAVEVVPGAQVLWEFSNLPEGFVPWIRFESDGTTPLGPFPGISQLSSTLLGAVPAGTAGTYKYRLLVRSRTGTTREQGHATVWSAEQKLVVAAAAAQRRSETPVAVTALPGNLLEVLPKLVILSSPSEALLAFSFSPEILDQSSGLLEPRIEFLKFTPAGGGRERASPPLGPFSALIFSGNTVWGSGDAGLRGAYNYQATALRQSTGEVVWASSTDPVIDDQREPPP